MAIHDHYSVSHSSFILLALEMSNFMSPGYIDHVFEKKIKTADQSH